MLSQESLPVVRATLPAVSANVGEIAELFYDKLFADRPELLRDLFNRGNQASGEQQQALAGSIAAFAGLLVDRPEQRPDALLSRIAHKHASLGITSEQYKLVHRHLFAAIAEVLCDAVTPEVAAAWDEVYWLMANALIATETRLYATAGRPEGDIWHQCVITAREQESPDAVSLRLRAADGARLPGFRPGQYVSVQVPLADGARQIRQYSLSGAPGRDEWRITVKRVADTAGGPDGEVSHRLHEQARPGQELTVSMPFGDLALEDGDGPLLLISAGIGITPMLSVVDHLTRTGSTRPLTVAHADTAPADHAHRTELHRHIDAHPHADLHLWYETPDTALEPGAHQGRIGLDALDLPAGVTVYLCGPLPFMRAVRGDLLHRGVPASAVHYEVFGPDLWLGQE